MRASEFISEGQKIGRLSKTKSFATVGLHKFVDPKRADRTYELNRVMMAAASTDGTFVPDIDGESWAGRYDIAAPYTKEENNMLKMAYKAIGSEFHDLNKGDLRSQELPSTSTESPVRPFQGYPR
jgi:hypothetical protein